MSVSRVSRLETALASAAAIACVVIVVSLAGRWPALLLEFGDNRAFLDVAVAMRNGTLHDVVPTAFWGLSYIVAFVAWATPLTEPQVLWVCSWVPAIAVVWLAHGLWGSAVATWFGVGVYAWVQRAALGGSEPVFMLLVLLMFTAARGGWMRLAALMAALATIVRPVGVIAVASVGIALAVRRDWPALARAMAIALAVAIVYSLPLFVIYHSPLVSVRFYQHRDWGGRILPFALPLMPLVHGYANAAFPVTITNAVKVAVYVVVVLAGCGLALVRGEARRALMSHPVELGFAVLSVVFLLCYDAPGWTWLEFPRFAIPVVPFALLGLEPWLPTRRSFVWPVAILSGVLAGISAVGVQPALQLVRSAFARAIT